ncbi:MAG TPA: DNA polymerase III subunit delta [Deltaproteobacteria bacterium]|nr:DNA polymerase III subunit delta [Deltaproteobacteria bacterium]
MKSPQISPPLKDSYLLTGEETFLIEEQLSSARTLMGEGGSMNYACYSAQEIHHIEEVVALCNTWPFLSDRRLVVIRNADKLSPKDQDTLVSYLKSPCEATTLILTIEGTPDRREKKGKDFGKKLPPSVEILRFDPLKGRDLIDWILSRARMYGKNMDKDAAYLLSDATGGSIWFIASEIEKLGLYVGNRPVITIKDVEYLVMRSLEPSVFSFLDSLFDKKKDVGFKLYELETAGLQELELLSRIEKLAAQHYQVIVEKQSSVPGINPYVEKRIASRRSLWSADQLISLLGEIRKVEHGIKSGRCLHPYAAVHEAIMGVVFPA